MNEKQFLVLTASAGSGKTYALALRYVYLLLEGAKVGEILALTFSNKAVDEMRERVGNFLLLLAEESKDPKQQEKQNELFDALSEYGWERERIKKLIPSILKSYWSQNPKIITLDAFFNSIVRRFCWYVGVPYQFQIGTLETEKIENQFFSYLKEKQKDQYIDVYIAQDRKDPFPLLNDLSGRFIDLSFDLDPLDADFYQAERKVLDCANKIKQSVLGHYEVSDKAIKAVGFETMQGLLQCGKTWINKGTEYRFFKKLGLDETMFMDLREALSEFFKAKEARFLSFAKEMLNFIQKARDFYFRKENLLDFVDVTSKTYELLCEKKIASDFFYFRLDDRISHILLDEFQDTSIIQYKILLPMIEEILSGEGRIGNRSFFAVGDEKQSIYRFRGGYGGLLGIVGEKNKKVRVESLDTNYRSGKVIVDFVNMIFDNKNTGFKEYLPQKSHKSGGYVKICDVIDIKNENDERSEENEGNGKDENKVFSRVKKEIDAFLDRGIALEDIAILVFKNSNASALGDYLKAYERYSPIATKESTLLSEKKDAQILIYALEYALGQSALAKMKLAKLLGRGLDDDVKVANIGVLNEDRLGEFIYQSMILHKLNSSIAKQVLEIACKSESFDDFFKEVRNSRGKEEFQDGLKILTIHGSKGLQFKHMIVLDQIGGENHQKDFFFAQYDENLKGTIRTYDSHRKNFDEKYAEVCEKEKKLEEQEDKNLLYVALTRACESLVLIPVKGRSKSKFESIGIVEDNRVLIDSVYGEDQSFDTPKVESGKIKEKQVLQGQFGKQEGFIQKEKLVYAPNNLRAILWGEMIHKALELYLGYQAQDEALLHFLKNQYGAWFEEEKFQELLPTLREAEMLLKEHFTWNEVQSEVSFIEDLGIYRIDCLLFDKDSDGNLKKIIILDYKSGRKDKNNQEQVERYVEFVKKQYPQVEVSGFLLYLNQLELIDVLKEE